MKKIITLTLATLLMVFFSGCADNKNVKTASMNTDKNIANVDIQKVCSIKDNGIDMVLKTASKYNKMAKKQGLEFKRLGMKSSQYISASKKALKMGEKMVTLLNKKGKPTKNKVTVEYASIRACKFAITALQQSLDAEQTWRSSIPGDGYKY